ncbi:MAG: S-layer homology domain-containing protein [Oscillospiraceae bacterium]|nr:S-layer homology domain-containing protein [Oscillospiraceae bacterium]
MKKLLCLCLAVVLLLGLGVPAVAEGVEGKDEQLRRVTLQVKTTLDIGDDYTSFNGDPYDRGETTWWYLSWYKDEEGLNVTCDSAGKVYSMNRYFYDESYSYSYTPSLHFPAFGYTQALAAAKKFLPTVLGPGEDAVFAPRQDSLQERSRYNLYGTLTLNGVETEIGLSLNFRTSDGLLLSFYRDDSEQLISGPVPSASPAFSAKEALPKFSEAVTGSLEWAYTDYEKHEVRLTYQLGLDYGVMLDAQTGELFDRWNNFRGYSNAAGGAMPEEAAAADMEKGLTAVELAGAEKLEGVLDGEALLAAARAESAFGITEDYVLGSVNYRAAEAAVDPATLEEGQETDDSVTASFTLVKTLTGPGDGLTKEEYDELTESGYTPTIYKYFTADANTGEIRGLSTSYYGFGWKEREAEEEPAISGIALGFLEAQYGDWLPLCELTSASQSRWSSPQNYFTYTRMEAGYPCPMNTISVTTNLETGFVDAFSCDWDEELSFGPAGPVVGEDAARESFLKCYEAALRYVLVPQDPENWETAYSWRLVYLADISDGWVKGVDAVTGEANYLSWSEEELSLPYTDLEGSYAKKEIETLAGYGVRFYGVEEFLPRAEVTELDMLLLMLSARGTRMDYSEALGYAEAGDEEALRWIYSEGYAQGFIASKEQAPFRSVTRTELCRCFVGLSGLSEAAALPGIFRTGFADEDSIPEADLGYVAIAKGLGVVQGDSDGAFRPEDTATRQELAVMLYRYLSR